MNRLFFILMIFTFQGMVYSQVNNKVLQCPNTFSINSNFISERGKPYVVEISVKDVGKSDVKYFWVIDKGEIISGQGTAKIKISTDNFDSLMETSVKIEGLPKSCQSEISEQIIIPHKGDQPILFDSYGNISLQEERKRFEKFYKELIKENDDSGLILLKSDNAEDLLIRLKNLNDFSISNNYDRSRLIMFVTDNKDELSGMWLIFAEMPECESCKRINLSTYIQDVQNLIDKKNSLEESESIEDN